MKIGVIGHGNVGMTLGEGWKKSGHEVQYGSREPEGDEIENHALMAWAEVIVLAIPYPALHEFLSGVTALDGKIVVDVTNPINPDFSGISNRLETSAGEEVAALLPNAHVVKAFNTVGYEIMANPQFPHGPATMLVAGDHVDSKQRVMGLAGDLGFDAVDAGPIIQSRYLEAFAWIWISLALKYGHGRDFAFMMIRR